MRFVLIVPVILIFTANLSSASSYDELLAAKENSRQAIIDARAPVMKPSAVMSESIDDLIDSNQLVHSNGKLIRRLVEMEALGWQSHHLTNDIWSGYTWLEYTGHTALRYSVIPGIGAKNFSEAHRSIRGDRNLLSVVSGKSDVAIDNLSPAEKFDLLFVDPKQYPNGAFTEFEWSEGVATYRRHGFVPKWTGYCHGWAAAAIQVARPKRAVDVLAADGKTKLRFYPQDIKALVSALWAGGLPRTRLLGSRCSLSSPRADRSGRVTNSACWSVNPALFHLAVVNQIAGAERNLVIDSFYDVEVWNYPIYAYKYSYFHPVMGKEVASVEEAKVERSKWKNDSFRRWRSKQATHIVGIKMEVDYVIASEPHKQLIDTPKDDKTYHNVYIYDLELDANGNAIGGEWHQKHHPDFLWVMASNERPKSRYETMATGDWNLQKSLPQSWRQAALEAAKGGRPLAKIVEKLAKASQ